MVDGRGYTLDVYPVRLGYLGGRRPSRAYYGRGRRRVVGASVARLKRVQA